MPAPTTATRRDGEAGRDGGVVLRRALGRRRTVRDLARRREVAQLELADHASWAHFVRTDHLWQVALGLAGVLPAFAEKARTASDQQKRPRPESGASSEPPIGIEPMTYSLRVNRSGRLS